MAGATARGWLLGADLGGTKGLLGLFEPGASRPALQLRYACAEFTGFEQMLARFLEDAAARLGAEAARPVQACIALAGPVEGPRARMTNLPWTIDASALRRRFALGPVRLANDFVAAAAGVDALQPSGYRELQAGEPWPEAPRVIVGPGTGLGAAMMFPVGRSWRIVGGEGGHLGLAPRDALESALLQWLWQAHGRVSAERVLCGPGLVSIYRFLAERDGASQSDALLAEDDPAQAISAAALEACRESAPDDGRVGHGMRAERQAALPGEAGQTARSVHAARAVVALDLFASMLGAFAGDLALVALPRAGLYLGGGVAPRVMDARRTALFLAGLRDKGRHAGLIGRMPVRLVLEPALGLIGAGELAAGRARVVGRPAARRPARPGRRPETGEPCPSGIG